MRNKGQVTIFVIIAIILVAALAFYLLFRSQSSITKVPSAMESVYTAFLSCLEEDLMTGEDILMSHGGYIDIPELELGSPYMPFSSQLNFLGMSIPYWYYISASNVEKNQIPSISEMEKELETFIEDQIFDCSFRDYYGDGFEIELEEPKADVRINENSIDIELNMDLTITRADDTVLVKEHSISINSKLGKLYDSAVKVYEEEQNNLFLEEYAIDVLRLYAPVDGAEITCSPLIWNAEEVFTELSEAIEINTMALKSKGANNDYFALNLPIDEDVRFITSSNWPHYFEVNPSEGVLMISKPVGTQSGLGILGFCYVAYHYVYNLRYPVLIQIYEGEEVFQFPIAVMIQGNNPRESLGGEAIEFEDLTFCEDASTFIEINTYDFNLVPVSADISYECFGSTCSIGKTSSTGFLEEKFPQCINGYILAKADGYKESKSLFSVMDEEELYLILDRLYEREVAIDLDGYYYDQEAIISFVSDDLTETIIYPETRTVELSEGNYNISVYIYQNSSLELGGETYEQCVDVPRSGIAGWFGFTKEECFDVTIPSQLISSALAGGGKDTYYITEQELSNSNRIIISAETLPRPTSLEELQENYVLFESKNLGVFFA